MALLGWLWLVSPFVLIAIIVHDRELQRAVASNLPQVRAAGSLGALMMFLGVMIVPDAIGATMYAIGTPLVGLLVFLRRDNRDDGGEEGPDEPPPDWDDFERAFRAHVLRRQTQPRRPRSPTVV